MTDSRPGLGSAFLAILRRELRLALRRWTEVMNPLMFFAVVTMLFPLSLEPSPDLLGRLAPGVLWVAALLSMLLAQESVFRDDFADGSLEQLALQPQPLWATVAAKLLAHWLLTGVPLVLISPLAAVALYLPADAIPVLMLSLLLGTPVLSLLGGVGAALTVGLHRAGVLMAILVLPLVVPTLIFGARATELASAGHSPAGALYLLGAVLVFSLCTSPFAAAAAVRIHLD